MSQNTHNFIWQLTQTEFMTPYIMHVIPFFDSVYHLKTLTIYATRLAIAFHCLIESPKNFDIF